MSIPDADQQEQLFAGSSGARKRRPLGKRAYEELKQLIMEGDLEPSGFLSERQLGERLGMSKTPIHAALGRLEAEGFVSVSPQKGVIVRALSVTAIIDHFEIREVLESYVVRRVAGTLNDRQRKQLEANLAAQTQHFDGENDVRQCALLDREFHQMLCSFLGNREFTRVMLNLQDRVYCAIFRVLRLDPARPVPSYQEHARIAEAIISGDGEAAAATMLSHLAYGKGRFLSVRDAVVDPSSSDRRV